MEAIALVIVLLAALVFQGLLFNRMVFKNLHYKCEFSVKEAHVGDEIYLVETVENRKLLPIPWLKVEIHSSKWLDFAGTKSVVSQDNRHVTSIFAIKSYKRVTRRWNLKCMKRGVFTIGNVSLVGGDPLGIYTPSIAVAANASLIVYPETLDLDNLLVPANILQGETIVRRWIVEDPFIVTGSRVYTPGDPMNRIDWRATARENRLMVKKHDFTSQFSLTAILNIQSIEYEYSSVVDKDIIELGIKAVATIFDKALRMGVPVRFATNGSTMDGGSNPGSTQIAAGSQHTSDLLKVLAKLELKSVEDFDIHLREISQNIDNSDVIIVTAYINDAICDTVRDIKKKGNAARIILLGNSANPDQLPWDIEIYNLPGGRNEG